MLISDKADDDKTDQATVANAMIVAWDNFKANAQHMNYQIGNPMTFFRSWWWSDESKWPWQKGKQPYKASALPVVDPALIEYEKHRQRWLKERADVQAERSTT